MSFSPQILLQRLQQFPRPAGYQVAYSGGMDSHVLLHSLAALRTQLALPVAAVHVNHGLHAHAADWDDHCRSVCAGLGLDYVALGVNGRAARGDSPEAAARTARYAALADWLPAGHCLLTAQHRDDQAETLLLQLLRGAGVHGLAAMPAHGVFGAGTRLRPLLEVTRDALRVYAERQRLTWIDDPSNFDTGLDRNYLRHQVFPQLRLRWPAAGASLARSAGHQAEAAALLDGIARQDLQAAAGAAPAQLRLPALAGLPLPRQRNAVRHWLRELTGGTPSAAVLARILQDVPDSRADAEPCVRWAGFELRRYRDTMHLLRQLPPPPDPARRLPWSLAEPLVLPARCGVLHTRHVTGQGIRRSAIGAAGVRVGWRRGGEHCAPAGRGQHHALKKLFQERGIPPWQRARTPLIFIDDRLAAVPGLWVCEPFQARPDESAVQIVWDDPAAQGGEQVHPGN
ncbi:MAG: tRNA lysidine(34) synthetase TilS [Gammaproteobacteria bacterium]